VTATVNELVERVAALTHEVRASEEPVSVAQWAAFEANLYRLLAGLLGQHGTRVPRPHPAAPVLRSLVDNYPHPPQSALGTMGLAPERITEIRDSHRRRQRSLHGIGKLAAVRDEDVMICPADTIDLPAPTERHPVARITCALGALADLVDVLEYAQVPLVADVAEPTAHVLAAAAVVARHTLLRGELGAADRPLAVARHAEAALVALRPALAAAPIRPFTGLPAVAGIGAGDGNALEKAVHAWTRATEDELRVRIPSADTLHALVNQGTHILATHATVLDGCSPEQPTDRASAAMREAAQALAAADQVWVPGLTTLTKPGHEFITASRELFLAFEDARTTANQLHRGDRLRAADTLERALATLSVRLTSARSLPKRLVDGRALYAPARQIAGTPERLHARLKGRYVPVEYHDIKSLDAAWREADNAIHRARTMLARTRGAILEPPPRSVGHDPLISAPSTA
jgi:hypothetical protein